MTELVWIAGSVALAVLAAVYVVVTARILARDDDRWSTCPDDDADDGGAPDPGGSQPREELVNG